MLYSSQTDNSVAALRVKPQTTSTDEVKEVKSYRFENTAIKFTESVPIVKNNISKEVENIIEEETEKKFYRKVLKTQGL